MLGMVMVDSLNMEIDIRHLTLPQSTHVSMAVLNYAYEYSCSPSHCVVVWRGGVNERP